MFFFFSEDTPVRIITVGSDGTFEPKSSIDALQALVDARSAWEGLLSDIRGDNDQVFSCRKLVEDQVARTCFFISAFRAIDRPHNTELKKRTVIKFITNQLRDKSKIWIDITTKNSSQLALALKKGDAASAQTSSDKLYRDWERRVGRDGVNTGDKDIQLADIVVLSDLALEASYDAWLQGRDNRLREEGEASKARLFDKQNSRIDELRRSFAELEEGLASYRLRLQGEVDAVEKRAAEAAKAYEALRQGFTQHLFEARNSNIGLEKKASENSEALIALESRLNAFKEASERVIDEHTAAIGDRLKLRAASEYWSTKGDRHTKRAYFGFAAFATLVGAVFGAAYAFSDTLFLTLDKIYSYQSGSVINIVGIVAISIPAALLFWVLRHVSRFMIEHFTSASDAAHRTAVIRTWIGLTVEEEKSNISENKTALSAEERKIVLSEMFRPPATDNRADSNSIPIIEIFQKIADPNKKKD